MASSPERHAYRVIIVGGGVAGLETMVALRSLAEDRVDVEILAPGREFVYRALAVAEPFGAGEVLRFDLEMLAEGSGARHRLGSLRALDPERHEIHTNRGLRLPYDALVIALGAGPRVGVRGALTFRGPEDVTTFRACLDEALAGETRRIVFAVPGGIAWALPLYELALLTASRLAAAGVVGAELTLVTPEEAPLTVFGSEASRRLEALLAERAVHLRLRTYPDAFANGQLTVVPGAPQPADRVIALPRLAGSFVAGLPQDPDGFVSVDPYGRVADIEDVYAAGDITTFPVKQGGIAAQQADTVAEAVAQAAGAPVLPTPFDPILRGLVLTGDGPAFLRAEIGGGRGDASEAAGEALWWPPGKIAARYLAPYLAERAGLAIGRGAATAPP
jgi:sulfide:quinone oxidoreductase